MFLPVYMGDLGLVKHIEGRREMLRNCLLGVLVLTLYSVVMGSNIYAGVFAEHVGSNDPNLVEGWNKYPPNPDNINLGPISEFGIDAWMVDDNDDDPDVTAELEYRWNLSQDDLADINNGWSLTAFVRIVDFPKTPTLATHVALNLDSHAYRLVFGTQDDNDPIVRLTLASNDAIYVDIPLENSGGDYHLYELTDPNGTGKADLYVDGVLRYEDYPGWDYTHPWGPAVTFGSGHRTETGHANYANVTFMTNDVPRCIARPLSDLNGDCVTDLGDLAIMVSEWLKCGWVPTTECWVRFD